MTTTTERVIGLWLDASGDQPKWIVSNDTIEAGEPSTSTTVAVYDDYEPAKANALGMGRRNGLRVIMTVRYGERKCLFDPTV